MFILFWIRSPFNIFTWIYDPEEWIRIRLFRVNEWRYSVYNVDVVICGNTTTSAAFFPTQVYSILVWEPKQIKCNVLPEIFLTAVSGLRRSVIIIVKPDIYLESLFPINLCRVTSIISSSKPSTCLLGPIPIRLLQEVLYLVSISLWHIINLSLTTGCVQMSFKIVVIKPRLKKPLDPDVLVKYRPISNPPFFSILEKAVMNQLCDFSHNSLF